MATLEQARAVRDLLRPVLSGQGHMHGIGIESESYDGYFIVVNSQGENPGVPVSGCINGVDIVFRGYAKIELQSIST